MTTAPLNLAGRISPDSVRERSNQPGQTARPVHLVVAAPPSVGEIMQGWIPLGCRAPLRSVEEILAGWCPIVEAAGDAAEIELVYESILARALTPIVHFATVSVLLVLVAVGIGPRTGAYRTLTLLSDSMSPGIAAGSVVVVTPEPASAVRVGQVISYRIPIEDHHVVTHRVVEVVQAGEHPLIKTKGDAADAVDPWIARLDDPVVWRARTAVPGLGYAIAFLRGRLAHRLSVSAIPLVLALIWVGEIWRRPRARRASQPARTHA